MAMNEIKRPVFFSGENPGMTLYLPGTEQAIAVVSYWYCTDSPFGVGHVLVLWLNPATTPVAEIGHGGIFTDNRNLAQVLVNNLTQHFPEFQDVPINTLSTIEAQCDHTFDSHRYQVKCQTPQIPIEIEWHKLLERKQVIWPRFPAGEAAYDLTTVICPCQMGQIQLNGKRIAGEARVTQAADGQFSSTAFLAFAETWIGPLEALGE